MFLLFAQDTSYIAIPTPIGELSSGYVLVKESTHKKLCELATENNSLRAEIQRLMNELIQAIWAKGEPATQPSQDDKELTVAIAEIAEFRRQNAELRASAQEALRTKQSLQKIVAKLEQKILELFL